MEVPIPLIGTAFWFIIGIGTGTRNGTLLYKDSWYWYWYGIKSNLIGNVPVTALPTIPVPILISIGIGIGIAAVFCLLLRKMVVYKCA